MSTRHFGPYPEVVGLAPELLEPLVDVVGVEGVIPETQEECACVLADHIVCNTIANSLKKGLSNSDRKKLLV